MYVSTQNQKVIVDIVKIKTIKWVGQFVVWFQEQTQSILPEVIKLSTVDRPEIYLIKRRWSFPSEVFFS